MTQEERRDAEELLVNLRRDIIEADPSVVGFNIGMNCGKSAGQTIEHAHIHLIPRRYGDTPQPQGGIRGAIPGRMAY
jgi:diadenosine tetraphosphate (Ap4A) HIT family hydrolase